MKKRGIGKKSQSGIITSVLLILIILVSIVIVSNVAHYLINRSSSQISADVFTTQIDIPLAKLYLTGGAQVQAHRKTGPGALTALTFIFEKKSGETKTIIRTTNLPNEMDTRTYNFNSTELPFNSIDISKVSVAPVFGTNTGIKTEESVYSKDSSGNRLLYLNDSLPFSLSNLISWWKLDNNPQDSIGTNHGTVTNAAFNPNGKSGSAGDFTGSASYVKVSSAAFAAYPATISLWFKANAITPEGGLLWNKMTLVSYDSIYWGLQISSSTNKIQYVYNDGVARYWQSTTPISTGQWYHLVAVSNSTNSIIYINGTNQGSSVLTWISNTGGTSQPFYISNLGDQGYSFNGLIDDVMIFNKALSPAEVQALYNSQK
jgi:flagellin-like protein